MKLKFLNNNDNLSFYAMENSSLNKVPMYGDSVSAGFPSPAEDYLDLDLNLHDYLVQNPAATFCVRANGDSMIDAGINDGDFAIIKKQSTANNGDIAVALTNENEATLKRFRKRGDTIALEAANESYETRIYSAGQISIQGILIGLIRQY